MLVAPPINPSEQASMLYIVKIVVSVAGFIIFCLGAILYFYALVRDRTGVATRSRRGSDGSECAREVWERPTYTSGGAQYPKSLRVPGDSRLL